MSSIEVDLVLVPVDGSDESTAAVEYGVAVADEYDAEVHVVYVLGEDVTRAIETGGVDEDAVAADSDSYFATLSQMADEVGVALSTSMAYGFSTTVKTRHPGVAILDTAEDLDADFVVVPREPVTDDPGEVLERAAEYVLLYASQPVLSI